MENDGIWMNRNKAGVFRTTTVQLHVPIAVPPFEVITAWIELAGRLVASEGLLEASRRLTIRGPRFSCTLYSCWVNSRRATVWEKWITARTQKMYATAHAWGKAINRWWIKGSYLIHRQYKTVYEFIHLEFEQVHIRHIHLPNNLSIPSTICILCRWIVLHLLKILTNKILSG